MASGFSILMGFQRGQSRRTHHLHDGSFGIAEGCRPGNEGKAPLGPAHLMKKRALIAMQYSALHHRTWVTPTVQKPCRNRALTPRQMKNRFIRQRLDGIGSSDRTPKIKSWRSALSRSRDEAVLPPDPCSWKRHCACFHKASLLRSVYPSCAPDRPGRCPSDLLARKYSAGR